MEKKWIPIEVNKLPSTDDFMERLNNWTKYPESDPELEEYYKYGHPEGLPFQIKKPEQWELDHDFYFPMYEEAQRLEQANLEAAALDIYLAIHERFIPRGAVYYDAPLWLLEKNEQFDNAIELVEKIISAVSQNLFAADIEPYQQLLIRLDKKKEQCKPYGSYEAFSFHVIIEILKYNPNINITNLQKMLLASDVYGGRNYIDKAVEQGLVLREQRGRSLIHNII